MHSALAGGDPVAGMVRTDPYRSDEPYHECMDCHNRVGADDGGGLCPECGGPLRNLAVSRE